MVGGIYHLLEDWSNALPWFQKTTARSPKSELASIGLLRCLWHHERFDEAFAEAKRFIQLRGMTADYSLLMGELDEDGEFD